MTNGIMHVEAEMARVMRWMITGVALAVVLAPTLARAQPADERSTEDRVAQQRARMHFQAGASHYESGSYEDALREFTRAYELSQRPELFYNFSLCYQNLGDLEHAIEYLGRFLSSVEDIPNRANLELRLENLELRLQAQARTETPAEADEEIAPPDSDVVDAPSDSEVESTDPEETETVTAAEPPAQEAQLNIPAIISFSVAGGGLVLAGIFGGLTLAEDANLAETCSPSCTDDQLATLRTRAFFTDLGFGIGLAGASVGLILLLVLDTSPSEHASLAPWLDDRGGGVLVGGSF